MSTARPWLLIISWGAAVALFSVVVDAKDWPPVLSLVALLAWGFWVVRLEERRLARLPRRGGLDPRRRRRRLVIIVVAGFTFNTAITVLAISRGWPAATPGGAWIAWFYVLVRLWPMDT